MCRGDGDASARFSPRLARAHASVRRALIADEVAVGFGRTGTMFACEQEDVVPDFLCLGKGLPAATCRWRRRLRMSRIYNAFLGKFHEGRTLHHGHTFSGNPLACAAALASLDVFEEEQTLANLPAKIARLGEHLCRLAEHPHVATTRQRGLIGALELDAGQIDRPALPRNGAPGVASVPRDARATASGCGRWPTCCTSCRRWRSRSRSLISNDMMHHADVPRDRHR